MGIGIKAKDVYGMIKVPTTNNQDCFKHFHGEELWWLGSLWKQLCLLEGRHKGVSNKI